MNLLQAASYVTIRPQVGIWVVSPSDEEITDFFTLYARSESLHTANATRRGSAEALEVLGVIADQIAAVGEPASPASGREQLVLSSLFHGLIRSMAATPWLCQHSASAWRMSNFLNANRPSLAAPSRCSAEGAMRRDIIAAMKTGDAKAAGALMEAFVMSRCTLPHSRGKRAGGVP
jgi:DNA-binding GntR family transcriptional regulator